MGILFIPKTWEGGPSSKGLPRSRRRPLEVASHAGCLACWGRGRGGRGPAVLTPLSSTGKNLYTNEYVAIKLVSLALPTTAEIVRAWGASRWGLGQGEGPAMPRVSRHLLHLVPPGAHQVPGTAAAP